MSLLEQQAQQYAALQHQQQQPPQQQQHQGQQGQQQQQQQQQQQHQHQHQQHHHQQHQWQQGHNPWMWGQTGVSVSVSVMGGDTQHLGVSLTSASTVTPDQHSILAVGSHTLLTNFHYLFLDGLVLHPLKCFEAESSSNCVYSVLLL